MYDPMTHFYTFNCRHCGTSFKVRSQFKWRRYCSPQCRTNAHPYKAPRYPRWTQQETRLLRELAGEVSINIIAERLGRTYAAVMNRAHYLGISLVRYGERHSSAKHSDALVEQARTLHDEGFGPTAIAAQLGIPKSAVNEYTIYRLRLGPPIEYYF